MATGQWGKNPNDNPFTVSSCEKSSSELVYCLPSFQCNRIIQVDTVLLECNQLLRLHLGYWTPVLHLHPRRILMPTTKSPHLMMMKLTRFRLTKRYRITSVISIRRRAIIRQILRHRPQRHWETHRRIRTWRTKEETTAPPQLRSILLFPEWLCTQESSTWLWAYVWFWSLHWPF